MKTLRNYFPHPTFDYSKINEQIFIGTNACCQTHFHWELLSKGVRCDISLEEAHLDRPYGVESFLWLPTRDHTPPSDRQLHIGVEALDQMLRSGSKVYLHCKNGHGRAPTLYAAYLILKYGMTPEKAIAQIKINRPSIHLEPIQLAFLQRLV